MVSRPREAGCEAGWGLRNWCKAGGSEEWGEAQQAERCAPQPQADRAGLQGKPGREARGEAGEGRRALEVTGTAWTFVGKLMRLL